MKYRIKQVIEIEAMRMPLTDDQQAARAVACWMVDHGYDEPGLDVHDVDDPYIYGDKVLPCYGENYLTFVDGECEEEITVGLGNWIIKGVTGYWFTQGNNEFEQTYEEIEKEPCPPAVSAERG